MKFTSDELLLLTSIVGNKYPFGVALKKVEKEEAIQRGEKARKGLIEKGILTPKAITSYGGAFLTLWEAYLKAENYVVINKCIIGIIDNRRCVIVTNMHEDEYDIASGDSSLIILSCLRNYSALCRADKNEISKDKRTLDYKQLSEVANSYGKNLLSVGVFSNFGRKVNEKFFYWNEDKVLMYDAETKEEFEVNPSYVRRFIFDGLKIKVEENKVGR